LPKITKSKLPGKKSPSKKIHYRRSTGVGGMMSLSLSMSLSGSTSFKSVAG